MIQIPTPPQPGASEAERLAFDNACLVADMWLRFEALKQAEAAQATREAHAHDDDWPKLQELAAKLQRKRERDAKRAKG